MEKKLLVRIEPQEKKDYKISGTEMKFSDLERKILLKHAQRALENAARIAKETGLSKMTNKEINQIIKEVRRSA